VFKSRNHPKTSLQCKPNFHIALGNASNKITYALLVYFATRP
jgi:hypothetical protein